MRIAARLALALLPLVTLLACGARVGGDLPDGGGGSSSGGSSGGRASSSSGQGCPAPAAVKSNIACSPDGLRCPANVAVTDCNGIANETVDCVCHWGKWYCDAPPSQPMCPTPPMTECPPAQSIVPNSGCNLPSTFTCGSATPDYDCNGNPAGYLQCKCNVGTWSCPVPDAGTTLCNCPPPMSIQAGAPCRPLPVTCPGGNPTGCFDDPTCPVGDPTRCYYWQFNCQNGGWVELGYAYPQCIMMDAGAGG